MSNKCKGTTEDLVLIEEGQVINNHRDGSEMLNDFCINVTSPIIVPDAITRE